MSAKTILRIERFLRSSPQAVVWHISHEHEYDELLSVCSFSHLQNKTETEHLLIDPVYLKQLLSDHPNGYVTGELVEHLKKEFVKYFEDVDFKRLV
jgi:hypothetical protein